MLLNFEAGEETVKVRRDDVLEGCESLRADLDEARQHPGTLTRAKSSASVSGFLTITARLSDRPEM